MDTNQESMFDGVPQNQSVAGVLRGRRPRGRSVAVGLVVGAVFGIGVGTAIAATDTDLVPAPPASSMVDEMDQMHESPAAQEMHEQLPPELRASMDDMHDQMLEMMSSGMTS